MASLDGCRVSDQQTICQCHPDLDGLCRPCCMFAPLWAKALVQLPNWLGITWMVGWALLGLEASALQHFDIAVSRKRFQHTLETQYDAFLGR